MRCSIALLTLLFVGLFTSNLAAQAPATFIVMIEGVPSNQGHVLVALYSKAADFPKTGHADYTRKVQAQQGRVQADFALLDPGAYAVAVIHDADDDGTVSSNALGIPKEAYGFGNDARGTFGPPDFTEAVVRFDGKAGTRVKIK